MNEQDTCDFAEIERRLREHYARRFGATPQHRALWTRLEPLIDVIDEKSQLFVGHVPVSEPPDVALGERNANAGRSGSAGSSWSNRRRTNRFGALAAAVGLVLLGVYVFHILAMGRGGTSSISRSATRQALRLHVLSGAELLTNADLHDVQMLSASDGWAVGDREPTDGKWQALILHLANGKWQEQDFTVADASLWWIDMASPYDGWAGGVFESRNAGFLLHYTNGQWNQVATPDGLAVSQIQMLSPDEGWAVEVRLGDTHPRDFYLLHYSGGSWTRVSSGGDSTVAISMLTSGAGWAAGAGGVIERFQGGAWSRWEQHAPGDVTTLQMVSATDGWLAGTAPSWDALPSEQHPFLMHFDGQRWAEVELPSLLALSQDLSGGQSPGAGDLSSSLGQIAMLSTSNGWMVGALHGATSLTFHYSDGKWQQDQFTVNMPLESISMISADEGWAVGSQHQHSNLDKFLTSSVILHYVHGAWSVYRP